jgi:hypothetical protein
MILSHLRSLFKRAESHDEPLDALRAAGYPPQIESGMCELIGPGEERNMICTQWYAMTWCRDHQGWTWRAL